MRRSSYLLQKEGSSERHAWNLKETIPVTCPYDLKPVATARELYGKKLEKRFSRPPSYSASAKNSVPL